MKDFDESKSFDINDIIELYQIKLFIDNEIYLAKWTSENIDQVKCTCVKMWATIVRFCAGLNSDNIETQFLQLESWTIEERFWELVAINSVYKKVTEKVFDKILRGEKIVVRAILQQKKLVDYYGVVIREFLLTYDKTAEFLLSQFVEKHAGPKKDIYFPKSLSLEDREDILIRYLESEDPNLNYVRLIVNIKKQPELCISDKTRLKAQRVEEKQNEELLDKNGAVAFGIQVVFDESQLTPVEIRKEGDITIYSYGSTLLKESKGSLAGLAHFKSIFQYLNRQGCVAMTSKEADLGTMERVFMSSKNEYPESWAFRYNDMLSFVQLSLYEESVLKPEKKSVENLVQFFVSDFLSTGFGLDGFHFNLPSEGTTYFEKIRTLLAEFDGLLKQYKLHFEDGEIDEDLLNISSSPLFFNAIPSFATKKYCYQKENKLVEINHSLFSDQSLLNIVDSAEGHSDNLYELLEKQEVLYSDFKKHQKLRLSLLFEQKYLFVDHNGYLRVWDKNELFVLQQLYKEEVLSYWHYSAECRIIIDRMIAQDLLVVEDTLFNRLEQSYFNYYLNKREFTNGLDLRNSFMHGSNPKSEEIQKKYYYILLRILVLVVLKIHDDQVLRLKVMRLCESASKKQE